MHGRPIRKRQDSEVHSKFRDESPKPNTPIPLDFRLDRPCDNALDPVQFQIGTVGKDPVIKAPRNYLKTGGPPNPSFPRKRESTRQPDDWRSLANLPGFQIVFSNEDSDVYGAQQHGPLMDVELPI